MHKINDNLYIDEDSIEMVEFSADCLNDEKMICCLTMKSGNQKHLTKPDEIAVIREILCMKEIRWSQDMRRIINGLNGVVKD